MRQMIVSSGQKRALDRYGRLRLFPFQFEQEWTEVCEMDATGFIRYRISRTGLKNLKFKNGVFTATYHWTEEVPDVIAQRKLQKLVDEFKVTGRERLVSTILDRSDYDGDSWSLMDELTKTKKRSRKLVIKNPTFLGLREWVGPIQEKHMPSSMSALTPDMLDRMRTSMALRGWSYE